MLDHAKDKHMKATLRIIDTEAYGEASAEELGMEVVYKYIPFYFDETKVESFFSDDDGINLSMTSGMTYFLHYEKETEENLIKYLESRGVFQPMV